MCFHIWAGCRNFGLDENKINIDMYFSGSQRMRTCWCRGFTAVRRAGDTYMKLSGGDWIFLYLSFSYFLAIVLLGPRFIFVISPDGFCNCRTNWGSWLKRTTRSFEIVDRIRLRMCSVPIHLGSLIIGRTFVWACVVVVEWFIISSSNFSLLRTGDLLNWATQEINLLNRVNL